jgi:hypothetical protein
MEKRFESKLAEHISTGRRRASPFGVKFLALAISVVAVFSIGAVAVLGVIAAQPAVRPPIVYDDVISGTDYLIYDISDLNEDGIPDDVVVVASSDTTDVFAVKREMTLKSGVWDAPSIPVKQYTKVVYTVNVRLRDLYWVNPVDLIVGQLDIMYNGAVLEEVSDSFMINGCEPVMTALDGTTVKADAVTADTTGEVWTVQLPDLTGFVFPGETPTPATYNEGDYISVSLMLKASYIEGTSLVGSESAFPAYATLEVDEFGNPIYIERIFDTVIPVPVVVP